MDNAVIVTIDTESGILHLNLDGFEGPLALLLELARAQKVDLVHLSIAQLADHYVRVLEEARIQRLELAADWLVMAAWLAWLKSRLLLPHLDEDDQEAMEAVGQLHERLFDLEHMRRLALWLGGRSLLGQHVFQRPVAEDHTQIDNTMLKADLSGLVVAYLSARRRGGRKKIYKPAPVIYWSAREARAAMMRLLQVGSVAGWHRLEKVIPSGLSIHISGSSQEELNSVALGRAGSEGEEGQAGQAGLAYRAAFAGALMAGLEMAKSGTLELRQKNAFGVIEWRGIL